MKATALFSSALALVGITAAHAQVTTDPVGYVTVTVNANADARVGISMQQAPVYTAGVTSVAVGEITVPATVPDIATDPHFVMVTSPGGALEGNWYEVTGYTATSIIVAEDLQAAGLTAADTVKVVPFWTLSDLLPSGGNFPQSPDVFNPAARLQLYNAAAIGINLVPTASYLYHDGSVGPEGWYNANNPGAGLQGDVILSPETYINIRNSTGTSVDIVFSGSVPVDIVSNVVISRVGGQQDNLIFNPYPAPITLGSSDLASDGVVSGSADVFNPGDVLRVFSSTPTGFNPLPDITLLYHDGSVGPEGWYNANNPGAGLQGAYEIPGGAALIVRKAAGADATITWSPPTPY